MKKSDPFLLRLGRGTARHWAATVVSWVVLVVLGFVTSLGLLGGASLFDRLETGDIVAPGQAQTARDLITSTDEGALNVTARVDGVDLLSPTLTRDVRELVRRLEAVDGVGRVSSPMSTPGWPRAREGWALVQDNDPEATSFLVVVEVGSEVGGPVQDAVLRVLRTDSRLLLAPHGAEVTVGGTGLLVDDVIDQIKADLTRGEGIALPLSLLLMVFVFGGFVAAGLPIAGAVASIAGALAILFGFSYAIELDATVVNIVTVMGLALCIDYGLLLVSRFREELGHLVGPDRGSASRAQVEEAVGAAVATAGRTVLFSALIVGISLSGLLLFEAPVMRAIGAAGVAVVLVALLVALTLVPALCSWGAARLVRRRGAEAAPEHGVFSRLARVVQRFPVLTTLASVAVLLLLALPALGLRLTASGVELLPPDAEQRVFFEELGEDYPVAASPTVVLVAQASPEQAAALVADLEQREQVTRVDEPRVLGPLPGGVEAPGAEPGGEELVSIGVHTEGSAMDQPARDVAAELRDADFPVPTWAAGQAASLQDFSDSVVDRAPWAALWIAGATFVLLFLLTGSVVIPVKALLLNVVSLGASLGILVWAFQDGALEGALGFESVGGIESVIPLMVLAFGFGLSMDYEVFLLARVIELHEEGHDDDTAVRVGLQRSGRIITSAAAIMVIVFSGFAAGEMLIIKQTGFALAVAVLIDATIVRMVIVPATMTMLGRWNWWAPRWLKRVHARFGVSEHGSPVRAA
ncbi:MMPL family transporter [Nocardioides solisilvae]|uniref:MMPL family transporter n=1 Tax=Nocardioides solisilvae TaxID=1542435 RepID=UPI000D749C6E|nr:MMPL family transporter [Nocardioides solisilvae]